MKKKTIEAENVVKANQAKLEEQASEIKDLKVQLTKGNQAQLEEQATEIKDLKVIEFPRNKP